MRHVFSDLEGLCIAIEMERRGEDFYRRAAKVSRAQGTVELLTALAGDECLHAREFTRLFDQASARRDAGGEETYDEETCAFLSAMAAEIVFPGGLMALRHAGFENARAVLETAMQSERDSIRFYTELSARAKDAQARTAFEEIARQERGHLNRLAGRLAALDDEA